MSFHIEYPRIIPERRPSGHSPAAPRYTLRWEQPVAMLTSQYHAIEASDLPWEAQKTFFEMAEASFAEADGPVAHERMRFLDEAGETNAVVVSYWLDATAHARWTQKSSLSAWFNAPKRLLGEQGCWRETIAVPYDRHETIYSAPHYRVGFGRTPGAVIEAMTTNGYFGAARDRFPVSAVDSLDTPFTGYPEVVDRIDTRGRRLFASSPHNMAALRSGQFWEPSEGEQRQDYLDNLQPKLHRGMDYLLSNKQDSGTLSLRIMTNVGEEGEDRDETSVLAHFLSLAQLEDWAKSHVTHLDIYGHAIAMNRKYREMRQVVTWHEAFVMPASCAFEYVNCHPATGLLACSDLYEQAK
jgi:aldoxime dehydratase